MAPAPAASALLEEWLAALVATPGLTALKTVAEARVVLLDDALRGLELVAREGGPVIDVGSGGGSPGIPLAAALPNLEVTLLEAERRKCAFLERWTERLPNLTVVWGRAEEQPLEGYRVALAKALAHPPTALEWLLPLVGEGGLAIVWVGPTADLDAAARVAELLGASVEASPVGLLAARKVGPTPPGFPRRVGVARKRPLA